MERPGVVLFRDNCPRDAAWNSQHLRVDGMDTTRRTRQDGRHWPTLYERSAGQSSALAETSRPSRLHLAMAMPDEGGRGGGRLGFVARSSVGSPPKLSSKTFVENFVAKFVDEWLECRDFDK